MKFVTFSQLCVVLNLGLLICSFQTHAQEYYKWVNANGVTTYSATPPPNQKTDPQLDPTKTRANSVAAVQNQSSANRHAQVTTQTQKSIAQASNQPISNQKVTTQTPKTAVATSSQTTTIAAQSYKAGGASVQTTKNPTTTAHQAIKSEPNSQLSNANLTATETLNYIKSCHGVRCTDTMGKHFNLVAGNTYLAANGAKCTKTGNNMRCNK